MDAAAAAVAAAAAAIAGPHDVAAMAGLPPSSTPEAVGRVAPDPVPVHRETEERVRADTLVTATAAVVRAPPAAVALVVEVPAGAVLAVAHGLEARPRVADSGRLRRMTPKPDGAKTVSVRPTESGKARRSAGPHGRMKTSDAGASPNGATAGTPAAPGATIRSTRTRTTRPLTNAARMAALEGLRLGRRHVSLVPSPRPLVSDFRPRQLRGMAGPVWSETRLRPRLAAS